MLLFLVGIVEDKTDLTIVLISPAQRTADVFDVLSMQLGFVLKQQRIRIPFVEASKPN